MCVFSSSLVWLHLTANNVADQYFRYLQMPRKSILGTKKRNLAFMQVFSSFSFSLSLSLSLSLFFFFFFT